MTEFEVAVAKQQMIVSAADKARAKRLKTLFDITPEDYDTILAFQDGECAICGRPPGKTRLAVDHNHKTGLVRGLLCWTCNVALGKFRDKDEVVESAWLYVYSPPATEALGRKTYGVLGRTTNKRRKKRVTRREKTAPKITLNERALSNGR